MYLSHPDDRIIWPDHTECYRSELHEMSHMGDDYKVVGIHSPMYDEAVEDLL